MGVIIGVAVLFATVALPIWAFVDALGRPATAFYAAGSNKTAWLIVLAVTFFLGFGFILSTFYLVSVRRRVRLTMGR